jgi:hypothetical protein
MTENPQKFGLGKIWLGREDAGQRFEVSKRPGCFTMHEPDPRFSGLSLHAPRSHTFCESYP